MKIPAAIVSAGLLLSSIPVIAATPPKFGATCPKSGLIQNYNGMKFTCIKSGKKLIWDKGNVIKVAAPTPSTSPTPNPKVPEPSPSQSATTSVKPPVSLAFDDRITPTSQLNSMENCQTTDKTPELNLGGMQLLKQGFPRPSGAVYGKSSARVLVIPLSFKDLPFTVTKPSTPLGLKSDLDLLKELVKEGAQRYSNVSGGRFKLTVDILPIEQWWQMDYPISFQGTWGLDNGGEILKIISEHPSKVFAENYDTYYFVTSQRAALGESTSAQAWFQQTVPSSPSGFANLALLSGGLNNVATFMHELGHSLFGFEDLYPFGEPGWKIPGATFPQYWDLMAGSAVTSISFLNWDKFLMGWLKSFEVRCITNQVSSIHYLTASDSSENPRVLFINLTPGVTLAAEPRVDGLSQKVLVYVINSYVSHGNVPILALDKLLSAGELKDLFGWRITVLDTDSNGALIQATKTDIDKFVIPPTPTQPPGNPNPIPNTAISVIKKEIVPSGPSTAILNLEVSGQKFYRVYATAPDDFQKVYFESGHISNSSRNIDVQITGLSCLKDTRVMVELSTLPEGKGDTLVLEIKLKAWKC